jgi:glycosyltransferase involved in cell wall biosynthesis
MQFETGKTLSIIVATYNSKETIERALISILTNKPIWLELVVKDGGSDDGTLKILEKYKSKIDFLISENDSSLYEALNIGTQTATGKYVFYMGSDDILISHSLLKVFPLLLEGKGSLLTLPVVINGNHKMEPDVSLPVPIVHHQGAIFNRLFVNKLGGYSSAFHVYSDFDLIARYTCQYGVRYADIPICNFSSGGISNNGLKSFSSLKELYRIYFKNGGRFFSKKWLLFTVRIIYYAIKGKSSR